MKNIIIGTAGHIDHGKSTLIKALTGIETDTLPEEKQKGVTINLGFAHYIDANGDKIGVVDVPGHEKFIKNMVAGATGIDFLLLTIACDDGVMPQTIEHVDIATILGIEKGIVVLTKRDLVSESRVEEVKKEIDEIFKGRFIEKLKKVEYSSKDLESIKKLKLEIQKELENFKKIEERKENFRMNIDRVFTIKGFGTVVTGTSLLGEVRVGDILTLLPRGSKHRVKGIQNHGEGVEVLESGNRAALNLSDLDVKEVARGDVLTKNLKLEKTDRIDGVFTLLNENFQIKNNTRVRVLIGTVEVIGRIKNIQKENIEKIKENYIQIELEDKIIVQKNDIAVIRNYSPLETIGGLKIINIHGNRVKNGDEEYLKNLKILFRGNQIDKIKQLLDESTTSLKTLKEIEVELEDKFHINEIENLFVDEEIELEINFDIQEIIKDKEKIDNLDIMSKKNYGTQKIRIDNFYQEFFKREALKKGISRAQIKSKLYPELLLTEFNRLIKFFINKKQLEEENGIIFPFGHKVKLSKDDKIMKDEVLTIYKKIGFNLEKKDEIEKKLEWNEEKLKEFTKLHNYLVENGFIIYLEDGYFIMRGFFKEGERRLREYLELNKKVTLGEFKDILQCSRKNALLILEKLDLIGVSKRIEDYRILKEVK